MKKLRDAVPFIGTLALMVLFLKLPETPDIGIFECKTCTSNDPYFTLISASYFALLIAISLLFPTFPKYRLARSGLVWAVSLAIVLGYLNYPGLCIACLIAHASHILIWGIWAIDPGKTIPSKIRFRERLYLISVAPLSVAALFSCLNLTFMAYNFKLKPPSLKIGQKAPLFEGDLIVNFISSHCAYCAEQLPIVTALANEFTNHRFVNITPQLSSKNINYTTPIEWIEDVDGKLRTAYKVQGFPMLFIIKSGKISKVISGVSNDFREKVVVCLNN